MPTDRRPPRRRAKSDLPAAGAVRGAVSSPIDAVIDEMESDNGTLALVTQIDEALATVAATSAQDAFDTTRPRIVEPVPITLDRVRHLRLPFWALKKFEEKAGVSAWDHNAVWAYPPKLDTLVTLIWAGLLDEDDSLTLEQVERMPGMDFANVHYLRHCLDECWGRNNPDASKDATNGADPNSNPQASPSTG